MHFRVLERRELVVLRTVRVILGEEGFCFVVAALLNYDDVRLIRGTDQADLLNHLGDSGT